MRGWRWWAAIVGLVVGLAVGLAACAPVFGAGNTVQWTPDELARIESLWIGNLGAAPPDPSNRFADDPRAAALGGQIFFDPRFSANGQVACSTCHQPARGFSDGLPRGQGIGLSRRGTMTVVGAAYAPFLFWDGRKDSLWAQALEPLEDPAEHGISRAEVARLVAEHYAVEYEAVFGPLPEPDSDVDQIFANTGKALAAFERGMLPGSTRFDGYVETLRAGEEGSPLGSSKPTAVFTRDEEAGLRLFIGKAGCVACHSGPLLSNQAFHNTGVPLAAGEAPDRGRAEAIEKLLADPFNCLGKFSDAGSGDCAELRFLQTGGAELEGAFKPPSLRGVGSSAPYMHNGVFGSLEAVVEHYNRAPLAVVGRSELAPLRLSAKERGQLVAFLRTLDAE